MRETQSMWRLVVDSVEELAIGVVAVVMSARDDPVGLLMTTWPKSNFGFDIMWKLLYDCVWWLNDEWKHERESTYKGLCGSA